MTQDGMVPILNGYRARDAGQSLLDQLSNIAEGLLACREAIWIQLTELV